jgi:hypothetical protein
MPAEHTGIRTLLAAACLVAVVAPTWAQPKAPLPDPLSPPDAQALVDRALANELRAAQDQGHPMRYMLHKSSPRLTSTKEIVETKDGAVARLISINNAPLDAADAEREQARLDNLLRDPGLQRHRKQVEDSDTSRALKVLRALPGAFLYQYAGSEGGPVGKLEKFTFHPNSRFTPPDLETEILTAMSGEIWIDAAQERVTRLDGRLDQDVDFGWGILGRLNKGGWIVIEQAEVSSGEWRTIRFQMSMSGRVFWKTRIFDTTEEEAQFAPVPVGLTYAEAIQILCGDSSHGGLGSTRPQHRSMDGDLKTSPNGGR